MSQCGYRKLQMDRARSRWLITVTRSCIEWADQGAERCNAAMPVVKQVCEAWYIIARFLCLLFANIVNFLWLIVTYVVWVPCKLLSPNKKKEDRINHVFVVMLENRSFDHMLGLSHIQGIDAVSGQATTIEGLKEHNNWNIDSNGAKVFVTSPADWAMPHDPGHEFQDVKEQLCGSNGNYPAINNSGFVTNYSEKHHFGDPAELMKCYAPDQLPVITTLAREFAVCDHWYSSVPGPTWPNRFFVHAASSGGLDHSPSALDIASSLLFNGYKFDNGTIFDRLDDEEIDWKIYKGDAFPQALAISGMNLKLLEGRFKDFEDFSNDVSDPRYSPSYVFIEPNYGTFLGRGNFTCGNSQHPLDDVTRGERLLKNIYEAIRNSPHWESSVLVIMYDEHGGFYDHVAPPATIAPGDSITDPENNRNHFDFQQLGVRIPAVIVSPLITKGTIDHTLYDHASVLATIENIFGLQPLTERDKHANTFKHLFSLVTPRTDAPALLPEPANSGIHCEDDIEVAARRTSEVRATPETTAPVDPSLQGFLHVAFLRDLHASPPEERERLATKYANIDSKLDAHQYMEEVHQKIKE